MPPRPLSSRRDPVCGSPGLHVFRRSLWRFFEHNELENAAHAGNLACCSRPPSPR